LIQDGRRKSSVEFDKDVNVFFEGEWWRMSSDVVTNIKAMSKNPH
jgi:hypothetical protein